MDVKVIDKKIDFIHCGFDCTAAEPALPRLEREIQQVEVDRQSRLQAAQKDPANVNEWAVAMFFVFLALTFFVWWKASVGWAVIPFFLCMAVGGSLHRPEPAKGINENCDKRAQRLRPVRRQPAATRLRQLNSTLGCKPMQRVGGGRSDTKCASVGASNSYSDPGRHTLASAASLPRQVCLSSDRASMKSDSRRDLISV